MPILTTIIFLPLLGAFLISLIQGEEEEVNRNARRVGLLTSTVTFVISLFLWARFEPAQGFQFVEIYEWMPTWAIRYQVGIDGISLFFVILATFLTPLCILTSWRSIHHRVREYMIAFLLLETLMVGMFCSLDLFLFYVFFEGVLIPMVLIIGIWGGERRIYSAFKFFLYTLAGSVLMLIALITLYAQADTSSLPTLMTQSIPFPLQKWLWLAFFVAFAVKIPMWPVHTWLPDAHVEAPTAGSVMLAGVLLKMGGYGLLRFSLPLFPEATVYYTPLVVILSLIAIIYTSLVALVQRDLKKLIAYSSIAHMGFVTLGLVTLNQQAVTGAVFQMISHGLISAALFLCVGVLYDRFHTREIKDFGGLVTRMPQYAFFFMLFTLASLGLPGTSGFVGEFLVLVGTFSFSTLAASLAALSMVLGASYSLWLYRRVIFGAPNIQLDIRHMVDLTWRERLSLGVLALAVIVAGLQPQLFTDNMAPTIENLLQGIHESNPTTVVKGVLSPFSHRLRVKESAHAPTLSS